MSIHADAQPSTPTRRNIEVLEQAQPTDLIRYGLIPEFVGRLPVVGVLGDLDKGNGDPSIVVDPRPITPNWHALADKFVDLDSFYDSGEVSGDGWNWSTSARAADTIEKTEPVNYASRGLSYDYEGTNRNVNVGYATPAERAIALLFRLCDTIK